MLVVVALGCGIVLGLAAADLAGPVYVRLLARWPLVPGPLGRPFLRAHRALLAHAGHHPYLIDCLKALELARDPAAIRAARARLRWWCALRPTTRP